MFCMFCMFCVFCMFCACMRARSDCWMDWKEASTGAVRSEGERVQPAKQSGMAAVWGKEEACTSTS